MTDSFLAGSYNVTRPSLRKIACGETMHKGADAYLREIVRALDDRRRLLNKLHQEAKAQEVREMIVHVLFVEYSITT